MPAADPHSFRYEPELCTLAEGQTLADWRRAEEERPDLEGAPKRRRQRRRRPNGRRGDAEALSGR